MTEPALGDLASLAPLPRLVGLVALDRASRVSLRALPAVALATGALALGIARWYPDVSRSFAVGLVLGVLLPFAWVPRDLRRRLLGLVREVDARLGADEAVTTAAELCFGHRGPAGPTVARVLRDAREILAVCEARAVLSRGSWRERAVAVGSLAVIVAGLALPVRPGSRTAASPVPTMRSAPLAAAAQEVATALDLAAAQDDRHARGLHELAAEAQSMARALAAGAPPGELLARADALEQRVANLGEGAPAATSPAAVDAALQELSGVPALRDALAQGDGGEFDAALRALAEGAAARDRASAANALARAAEAARRAGSPELGARLDESAARLRRRAEATVLARSLAAALGGSPEGRRMAEHLARGVGDEALDGALGEALRAFERGLSPEERPRIAAALRDLAQASDPGAPADTDRATRAISPEEARAAVRAMVEALRRESRERAHEGLAARAHADARERIARLRAGLQTGTLAADRGVSGAPEGPTRGTARETAALAARGFRAPTTTASDPRGATVVVGTERREVTGARALSPVEASVRAAGPEALHGIERVAMPPAWRAQVRTYFVR